MLANLLILLKLNSTQFCFPSQKALCSCGGKALARVAGVSESLVSQFRHGKKGVTDEMLDNLLQAMQKIAPGARKHFCSLVAGELVEGAGVENAIKEISAEEIPELLMAIMRCWKSVDHP